MKKYFTKELQPGMLTALPIFSKHGQELLEEHSVLSTQKIAHINFYGIEEVYILTEDELDALDLDDMLGVNKKPYTYSQQVKRSPDFKKFQKDYTKQIAALQNSFNDVVKRNQSIDTKNLLEQTELLYKNHMTSLSLFDMLHNMRQIDDSTFAHSLNVSLISRMLGRWLGYKAEDLDVLTLAGLLHDIGKCMIPPEIVQKPGKLTDEEYTEIKRHPQLGYDILKPQDLDTHVKNSALMHHERMDGSGYPKGLKGDSIDSIAQIVSIADVYDAMTANRCYRRGLCPFEVIATFEKEGLLKYRPEYILTFLKYISNTYMNNNVLLNDGREGNIILMNPQRLSRPVIKISDGSFVDLLKHRELYIEAIL